jgi:hypothetical protein
MEKAGIAARLFLSVNTTPFNGRSLRVALVSFCYVI